MNVTELVRIAKSKGIQSEDLDEEIHRIFLRMASAVNNEGLDAQIVYLMESGYSDNDLLEVFEEVKS